MFSYLIQRVLVMIPTLLGITLVSFCVMQLAPGDPQMNQLSGGAAGKSTQTREAFLIQKRDLHLDKPLVVNFNYFRDFAPKVRAAAYYRARKPEEIQADLPELAAAAVTPSDAPSPGGDVPSLAERLAFVHSLGIPDFKARLENKDTWELLAKSIEFYTQVFCEDNGLYGVPAAIAILQDPHAEQRMKIGAIRCLVQMVPDPFLYTYSVHPSDAETPAVTAAWRLWWKQHQKEFGPVEADDRKAFDEKLPDLTSGSEKKLAAAIDAVHDADVNNVAPRYFAEKLLDDKSSLAVRAAATTYLKSFYNEPLRLDVPTDASAKLVDEVAANWLEHYELNQTDYEIGLAGRLWRVVADTQYAHMLARLATFQFGRSALRTREPVSEKIWSALIVSAPLMLMSELLIYLIAVPLGIVCGVFRGRLFDRTASILLFMLYSIPPFIAGMLFLVFFCYGGYLKLFPMLGLHSDGAEHMTFFPYLLDYFWHALLPVVCLSLFSLAAMAMYSRSAMLDVINQDFIRTARAKGLTGSRVIVKHALRNALIPILTLFSSFLPAMLGGSVLIEAIFDIPGMGRLGFNSIQQKDFPTLMALLYIEAIIVMLSILITDLLYVVVDPRISFSARGQAA